MSNAVTPTAASPAAAYVSEAKIYPREVPGRFRTLRLTAVIALLGLFYGMPWLRWDGRQAVLFDLPARKFYVLGLTFWPQDFVFLALLLIMAALCLFFFTTLAGRLWCGYACPQTVWTEVFLLIESWTEGTRLQRQKLDAAPWSAGKLARKAAKHSLWVVLALWTGFTFVGFFTPIVGLGARLGELQWGGWETFWVLFYGFATWGNAGFLREQVCKYMCPYARFQSSMFDPNTLIIAYDTARGEPRGSRGRQVESVMTRGRQGSSSALGDCLDCTLCVQACPTGIDIRNGLQYECIACGACIDACDSVMAKVGYPKGLVRYATERSLVGEPTRLLRPRIIVYGALLLVLAAAWVWGVTHRDSFTLEVLRDRNAMYFVGPGGRISNGYTLKIANKGDRALACRADVESHDGLQLRDAPLAIALPPAEVTTVAALVRGPADMRGHVKLEFRLRCEGQPGEREFRTTFFAPLTERP